MILSFTLCANTIFVYKSWQMPRLPHALFSNAEFYFQRYSSNSLPRDLTQVHRILLYKEDPMTMTMQDIEHLWISTPHSNKQIRPTRKSNEGEMQAVCQTTLIIVIETQANFRLKKQASFFRT